jgi:hypothetical protein
MVLLLKTLGILALHHMSNGKKDFPLDSNIVEGYKYGPDSDGKSFYAKKYMFSIENLAWRTSDKSGFTVLDLPYCERGPNGGRVMWFPPYDLKVSENNQAYLGSKQIFR